MSPSDSKRDGTPSRKGSVIDIALREVSGVCLRHGERLTLRLALVVISLSMSCSGHSAGGADCDRTVAPRTATHGPLVTLSVQMGAGPECEVHLLNVGDATAESVLVTVEYCDSAVHRLAADSLPPNAGTIYRVGSKLLDGGPTCPIVGRVSWKGGENRVETPGCVKFSGWETLDAVHATGWVTYGRAEGAAPFLGFSLAESVVVHVRSRDGAHTVPTSPAAIERGYRGQFVCTPGDSEGVAVYPVIEKVTWSGGSWSPPAP